MNESENKVIIYTDGASSGNPGPGGWGAVMLREGKVSELGGGEEKTTNNRMEMKAALNALKQTEIGDNIFLYTDSQYLINGITKWVFGWMKNDWKTQGKGDVLNKDIWQDMYEVVKDRKIEWVAVRGHAGVKLNNRVDEIAVAFSKNENTYLFFGDASDYKFEVKPPTAEEMAAGSNNDRKGKKAYSYLSMVNGEIRKHKTWAETEERVKGVAGAKFRKSLSPEEELEIIEGWKKTL